MEKRKEGDTSVANGGREALSAVCEAFSFGGLEDSREDRPQQSCTKRAATNEGSVIQHDTGMLQAHAIRLVPSGLDPVMNTTLQRLIDYPQPHLHTPSSLTENQNYNYNHAKHTTPYPPRPKQPCHHPHRPSTSSCPSSPTLSSSSSSPLSQPSLPLPPPQHTR